MKQILVTGANGQLGLSFKKIALAFPDFQLHLLNRDLLDITQNQSVHSLFQSHSFDYCINCAAYTAVDRAESEEEKAHRINVAGVENLARACQKSEIPLIHFSTDYVYHNQQNTPFKESAPTSPKSIYAQTKLKGEQAAQAIHQQVMIIRTSWVYAEFGHNFVQTMLRLGRERDQLRVVFDQVGSPTYAPDLARGVLEILRKAERKEVALEALNDIYNYSNEGVASWYDFALAIFELTEIDCQVEPIETRDFPTPAQRPPFSLLNKAKIKDTFGLAIPHWRESLRICLQSFQD